MNREILFPHCRMSNGTDHITLTLYFCTGDLGSDSPSVFRNASHDKWCRCKADGALRKGTSTSRQPHSGPFTSGSHIHHQCHQRSFDRADHDLDQSLRHLSGFSPRHLDSRRATENTPHSFFGSWKGWQYRCRSPFGFSTCLISVPSLDGRPEHLGSA